MEIVRLVCKRTFFYSTFDDDAFFEWLKKIPCVSSIGGVGEERHIDINKGKLTEIDLRELLGLFCRYKVDMKQLAVFLNEKNKSWFFDNKEAYWHSRVFSDQERLRA